MSSTDTQVSSPWDTQVSMASARTPLPIWARCSMWSAFFSFLPILALGGAAAGLVGYVVGVPILRLRDDFLAIATLGFGILVRVLLDNSDRVSEVLGGSRGFIGIPKIVNLEIAFFTMVFLILVTRNLIFSRYGLFWQCIKDDELASSAFGINTARMKLMAFTYGCVLAGVGGALYAYLYSFLHPSNFDFLRSIDFLIIVIVGGMGSITGTIYAGLLWVAVIEGLRIALPAEVLEFRWVLIPIFLIVVMMWKPFRTSGAKRIKIPRPGQRRMKALEVNGLRKSFGGVQAVDDLTFSVEEHETLGVIGPNGAGKTTLFNLISGIYRPDAGKGLLFRTVSRPSACASPFPSRYSQNISEPEALQQSHRFAESHCAYSRHEKLWIELCRLQKAPLLQRREGCRGEGAHAARILSSSPAREK